MNHWIFQGNPDSFDIDGYLEERSTILWTVRQRHLAESMQVSDEVFIWRSSGASGRIGGVVALGCISDLPKELPEDPYAVKYWRDGIFEVPALRVAVEISQICLHDKQVVNRKWLEQDPAVSDMRSAGTALPLQGSCSSVTGSERR